MRALQPTFVSTHNILYSDNKVLHDKYRYSLACNYGIWLNFSPRKLIEVPDFIRFGPGRKLLIKMPYAWDGPSGPTIDTLNFMRGSLIHDALYQLIREGKLHVSYRKKVDAELYRLCREDGMSRIRAYYVWLSVRLFGGAHIKPDGYMGG